MAIAKEAFDQTKGDLDEARAAVEVAKANLEVAQQNLDFTRVYAPITGRISRRYVDPGNIVKADDTLLTGIAAVNPMYAVFDVDERTVLKVIRLLDEGKMLALMGDPAGQADFVASTAGLLGTLPGRGCLLSTCLLFHRKQQIPFEMGLADEEGFPYQGVIDFADNKVDTSTGTLRVRGVFQNTKGTFTPGLFLRVRIKVGDPRPALLVVERAIGSNQGEKFVYVVNDKNEVVYRPVKLGPLVDGRRVIEKAQKPEDELRPTDRVIVNNLQRVREKSIVRPTLKKMPSGNEKR
jgi:RND family efflux transporter MFP subunit